MATTIEQNKLEVFYEASPNNLIGNEAVHFIFPPLDLYNNNGEFIEPYVSRPDDLIKNADIAILKLKTFADSTQDDTWADGEFEKTNVAGAFYAVEADDYYYKYTGGGALVAPSLARKDPSDLGDPRIAESIKLPLNSTGATFENKSLGMITPNVNKFDDIEVDGLNEGDKPDGLNMTAIRLEGTQVEDVTFRMFDEANLTNPKTTVPNANTLKLQIALQAGRSGFTGVDATLLEENLNEFVNEKGSIFTEASTYVSAVEIVNVERDLDDNRYGDQQDDYPFIFTGASHYFTSGQVAANTPIDLDVWGGDCFIGLHTFKISNSTYSLTDPVKDIDGSGLEGVVAYQADKWGHYFQKTGISPAEDISRPFPLKGVSQTITVLLESEINPQVAEKTTHNEFNYDQGVAIGETNLPLPIVDNAGQIRSSFKYYYNLDYSKENIYKVFFPYQSYEKNNNEFGARVPYSDQKVYNTDIEGFDRFRVANFYDLDESHGSGMKLVEAADRIFSIQESALSYIPINANVIQTADGSNLSVRNAEIIGTPNKIDVLYGTQHPKSVKVDGTTFFFTDALRGEVLMFDGQKVKRISNDGMETFFATQFAALSTHSDLSAIYDNKSKEYMVYFRDSDSAVYNAEYGVWGQRFPETSGSKNTLGGVRAGGTMMLAGINGTPDVQIASLYTGAVHSWWGSVEQPYFKFYIAPEPDTIKTFDGFTFNADREPVPQTLIVTQNDGTNILSTIVGNATMKSVEGNFRIKNFREATTNRRSRGLVGELLVNLNASNQSGMTSVLTKYRTSYRPI